jgi:hypothetical protein
LAKAGKALDIGTWLCSLGLDRYERVFRDNAIDAEVLPALSEGDLEKLGVLLGHRKRILRAIEALRITPFRPRQPRQPRNPRTATRTAPNAGN